MSRTHPGLLKRLFEIEVPEIAEGIIEIKSVARDAGTRSKISVVSNDENIDPVGSCLGDKGIRVQAINNEIGNEKIDVIAWSPDPVFFVSNALAPAKVLSIAINEREKVARVVVPNQQLSLAIGREGQNARLAAKLTGWRIDIKSKDQADENPLGDDFVVTKFKKQKKQKKKKPVELQPAEGATLEGGIEGQTQRPAVEGEAPAKKKKKKKKKKSADQPFDQGFEPPMVTNEPSQPATTFNFFDDDDDD